MRAIKIKSNVYWVGVKNPDLRVFDIVMTTDKGTTYNSYLIDDEKVVLIDTVKDGFFEEFISNIKSVIGDRKIDYVVVNHTEPDHSGSLFKILEMYPDAVVCASKPALMNLKNILNREFTGVEITQDLNVGKRTLKFITAPFLHWPDTIFTYDEYDSILFTCDAFGCHFCDDSIFGDEAGDFSNEFKYYFNMIMGPFKKNILLAADKIKDLNIEIIAPSHGPVHRSNPMYYVNEYVKMAREGLAFNEKTAVVAYVSAYGYTKALAKEVAEGIKAEGVKPYLLEITDNTLPEIVERIETAKAVAIGSPTINQDAVKPVWDVLSQISSIAARGKAALSFGSYGWSGEGVTMVNERLKGLKFKTIENGFKVCFKPTPEDLEKAREYGRELGKAAL